MSNELSIAERSKDGKIKKIVVLKSVYNSNDLIEDPKIRNTPYS